MANQEPLAEAGPGSAAELFAMDAGPRDPEGEACENFRNAAGSPITISIRNRGSKPIYLGVEEQSCGLSELFSIHGPDGALDVRTDVCDTTCETLQQENRSCARGPGCLLVPVIRIDAGGSYEATWNSVIAREAPMPSSCYQSASEAAASCRQWVDAPAGQFRVSVAAWTEWMCVAGPCECQMNDGACKTTNEATVAGARHTASTEFSLPDASRVEVEFALD